ncbi:lysine/ornithine N-monooxygenase [Virgisporangium aliadipatigenens]|uniref:L-lysine N6-monooxygenase MbtG n=1 Tax=Virgisporangium aliadipatigenens TaxID=741659 RepID=A0A8J4DNB9_9ACTN|nr:lysine N(6)-hydroxylase/L-ornithine N(5)-oxygenase family protein [Virgisporangium aliadipatigenens]GIJ44244.1 lysine/ornithine N-monooxygenase [Virgisporangium aliadipatigenens]
MDTTLAAAEVYDVLGVGFGPSNLALAIALDEHNGYVPADAAFRARFVERQARFGWHRGMLIDGTTLQVSFLKDLVTMRNPTSRFSFVSYLHQMGRLTDFINHKILFPSRVEFHDYLDWTARQLNDLVSYDTTVTRIRPVAASDQTYPLLEVSSTDGAGAHTTHLTRNVILAPGLRPHLPAGIETGDRIWHSSELMHRVDELERRPPGRITVVGAGQSAAELTDYFHRTFPDAVVWSVFSRYGYSQSDDNPFANQIFDPDAVDDFFRAPEPTKQLMLDYHANTNYSVVDLDLLNEIYRRTYDEKVRGRSRLHFVRMARVRSARANATGVRIEVENLIDGTRPVIDADLLVFATGYLPADPTVLLDGADRFCRRDRHGRVIIDRDYRAVTVDGFSAGIYLLGSGTEHAHGLSANLLSTVAIRAGEVVESLSKPDRRAWASSAATGMSLKVEMPATTLK